MITGRSVSVSKGVKTANDMGLEKIEVLMFLNSNCRTNELIAVAKNAMALKKCAI